MARILSTLRASSGGDAGEGEPGRRGLRRTGAGSAAERSERHQSDLPADGLMPPPPMPPSGPRPGARSLPRTDAAMRSR